MMFVCKVLKVFFIIVALAIVWDGVIGLYRKYNRRTMFAMAQRRAKETRKPLLVIGDPYNGFSNMITGADYEHGDICLDISGCPNAPDGVQIIKGRVEEEIPKMKDDGYVVFISCTLEYVKDFDKTVVDHLFRISGGDIFMVRVEPYSFTSRFYFGRFFTNEKHGAQRYFTKYPPVDHVMEWVDL